jgi:hypothetical protein
MQKLRELLEKKAEEYARSNIIFSVRSDIKLRGSEEEAMRIFSSAAYSPTGPDDPIVRLHKIQKIEKEMEKIKQDLEDQATEYNRLCLEHNTLIDEIEEIDRRKKKTSKEPK